MSRAGIKPPVIAVRRAYEEPAEADGYRVLVDRIWPRGRSKTSLRVDEWARGLAPTDALRTWFRHDPQRWDLFQERYRAELLTADKEQQMRTLLEQAGHQRVTLVYGAKDEQHNQAVVLREVMTALFRR